MDDNVIYNDRDEAIGYYKDLDNLYKELIVSATKQGDYEEVKSLTEQAGEIKEYKEYTELLVLSENNGMGFTVKPYKGEE